MTRFSVFGESWWRYCARIILDCAVFMLDHRGLDAFNSSLNNGNNGKRTAWQVNFKPNHDDTFCGTIGVITKGCTRSTHSGGCEVVNFSFVPGEPRRYPDGDAGECPVNATRADSRMPNLRYRHTGTARRTCSNRLESCSKTSIKGIPLATRDGSGDNQTRGDSTSTTREKLAAGTLDG